MSPTLSELLKWKGIALARHVRSGLDDDGQVAWIEFDGTRFVRQQDGTYILLDHDTNQHTQQRID